MNGTNVLKTIGAISITIVIAITVLSVTRAENLTPIYILLGFVGPLIASLFALLKSAEIKEKVAETQQAVHEAGRTAAEVAEDVRRSRDNVAFTAAAVQQRQEELLKAIHTLVNSQRDAMVTEIAKLKADLAVSQNKEAKP
jgi:hypothetical protein